MPPLPSQTAPTGNSLTSAPEKRSALQMLNHPDKSAANFIRALHPIYFQGLAARWISHPFGSLPLDALSFKRKPAAQHDFKAASESVARAITIIGVGKLESIRSSYNGQLSSFVEQVNAFIDRNVSVDAATSPLKKLLDSYPQIVRANHEQAEVSSLPLDKLGVLKEELIADGNRFETSLTAYRLTALATIQALRETGAVKGGALGEFEHLLLEASTRPVMGRYSDGTLPWVCPEDIRQTAAGFSVQYGKTSYFQYMGTREGFLPIEDEDRAMQIATATVPFVIEGDRKFLLFTLRSARNEAFPSTYHIIGGTGEYRENATEMNPFRHILREITEEAGIPSSALRIPERPLVGITIEDYYKYVQPVYEVFIEGLEQFTRFDKTYGEGSDAVSEQFFRFRNARPKLGEVDLKLVPWEAETIQNLLTGISMKAGLNTGEGDPLPRAWVPSAARATLEIGRRDFGQSWYATTLAAYELFLKTLGELR